MKVLLDLLHFLIKREFFAGGFGERCNVVAAVSAELEVWRIGRLAPWAEVAGSITITIADIITDKRRVYPLLPQMRISLDECLIVYHPFIESRDELVHANMHFSFDKKSLAFGTGL